MLQSINMVRTLSCILIAIFHVTEFANANSDDLDITFKLSAPGFHLFLQISGVILILITKPGETPFKFFIKRASRIIPLYWLLTTITIGLTLFRPWLFPDADLSTSSILSSYAFLPHQNLSGDVVQPILFVGWTLNYVILFYALFSVALTFPAQAQPWVTIGSIFALMGIAQILDSPYREFYSDPILIEFASGCVLGVILRQPVIVAWSKRTPMWPIALVGIAGLIVATIIDADGYAEVFTFAPAAAILIFACAAQDLYREPLQLGILNHGGKISFGVYLIHPLLIPILGGLLFPLLGANWLALYSLTFIVLGLTILLAWSSEMFFETPMNTHIRKVFSLSGKRSSIKRAI